MTCFVDMDGVLFDFMGAAMARHGRLDVLENYPAGVWAVEEHLGITAGQFWKPLEAMQFTQENRPEIERWLDESVELVAVDQEYMVLQNDTSSTLVYEGQYIIRDSVSSLGYTVMGQEVFEFLYQQITSR